MRSLHVLTGMSPELDATQGGRASVVANSMTDSSSCARSNPGRPPFGIASAVVVNSALGRRYPVSCALQVGDGVLPRLRPHAFFARPFAARLTRMAALSCLPVAIAPLRLSQGSQLNIFGAAS